MPWSQTNIYRLLLSFVIRFFLLFSIWVILTNGDISSWWIGIPVLLFTTALSIKLNPPVSWHIGAFVRFLPFYFYHSLRGGLDVMMRVFHPKLPINPAIIQYRLSLSKGIGQDMIVNVLNLLPGTLSVEIEQNLIHIHIIDADMDMIREIALIEAHIDKIFSRRSYE